MAGLPPISSRQPVDFFLETSGMGLVSHQPVADRRPLLVSDGETAYLKFDGKDDFLLFNGQRRSVTNLTVFVLAAPKSNEGDFSGLFATAPAGRNDYTSGFNLDFGPFKTRELSVLNVESAGAGGFRDLLVPGFFNAGERPFGDFHLFTLRSQVGKIEVFMDGFKGGERERSESVIGIDQIAVGSRFYSNDGNQPPYAQGSLDGAIAEVLVFDRALNDLEKQAVEQSLLARTVSLNALLHGAKGHALETVKDPPVVQMLVPGFTVHELALKVGNLNNVRYRHDGKLVGLGYDGRIHLFSDTDGDGLEDKDELFWDKQTLRAPIGMALTRKDDPRGDGIFVASKGKVSFIVDQNRDGRADEEKIIATGWPELPHGVDTLGLAVDPKDGAIYFGLGCANFVDAYLMDRATGRSRYSLDDIHGTIQRVSADFSKRETICTGVRFTCALAFNTEGDLFATDQEGATWLSNGNPLDELLHIQRGKHYGFPPRHPKHLPSVIDEPPVSEYGPQHQSTVGLVFNEGVNGGPSFGPAHWEGDAIICGESRGKIWRTKLAKTDRGYVAQNHLIACLSLLTVDSCVTPAGDLLVACHSGPPDWGTGPTGQGRIFKIRYAERKLPQPVLTWAAAPDEFRIAFDRPLDPADWANAVEKIKIEAGQHVSAGDRFEVIRPGYQVVRDQMALPRRWIKPLGLTFADAGRTLVLRVPRQSEAANYAVTLPLPERWKATGGISQHREIDVLVSLNGVAATVVTREGKELRTVLSHPNLAAAAVFSAGSVEQEEFLQAAATRGSRMTIRAEVDNSNPFVPAAQPGSKRDWDVKADPFASATFKVRNGNSGESEIEMSATDRLQRLRSVFETNAAPEGLYLEKDNLRHVLSTTRLYVPWASEGTNSLGSGSLAQRTDVKGHWIRGRRLFFADAGCATCHTVRGEGIAFGPDLSNLVHRDRESVLNDILRPSATINPDHIGTLVTLKNGTALSGIVRSMSDSKIKLALPAGAETELSRAEIAGIEPLKTSLMTEGLGQTLSSEQVEDLLTFLLVNPIEPALVTRTDPPRPTARRLSEVKDVIGASSVPQETGPLRVLLCAGPKDHGMDEHDYPLWLERWSKLLALGENVTVTTSMGFPTGNQFGNSDVAVFFNANPDWNAEKAAALDTFHKRGGGAVYIHYAVDGGKDPNGVAERMGLAFTLGSRFRHGEFDLVFSKVEHPITQGFPTLHFTDETYWKMRGDISRLKVLGTSREDGADQPQLWVLERYESRIVGCIPGHYTWTFDDPLFRVLLLRSICWAAKQPNVNRLADLATVGVAFQPE